MRIAQFSRLILAALSLSLLFTIVEAQTVSDEAARMLPDQVGNARAQGAANPAPLSVPHSAVGLEAFGARDATTRQYISTGGERFIVSIVRMRSDSAAYSLLSANALRARRNNGQQFARLSDLGIAAYSNGSEIYFAKGASFVVVEVRNGRVGNNAPAIDFARSFAETLDQGEGEIPPLVKHLPEWTTAQERAVYAVSLPTLQEAAGNRPLLDALSFDGGAEAVTADYGMARLVIVENMTPQLASANDARINERLEQMRGAGQTSLPLYRRVGNYSVFVFDAPDEQTAQQIADGVHYEQVVQWLGHNPRALQRAQRAYGMMTANVILNTIKAVGLSIVLCLGVGGIIGGLVFMRRRSRATENEAYTDAGGMLRLNIDELTSRQESSRLLSSGEQ